MPLMAGFMIIANDSEEELQVYTMVKFFLKERSRCLWAQELELAYVQVPNAHHFVGF